MRRRVTSGSPLPSAASERSPATRDGKAGIASPERPFWKDWVRSA